MTRVDRIKEKFSRSTTQLLWIFEIENARIPATISWPAYSEWEARSGILATVAFVLPEKLGKLLRKVELS